MYLTGSHATTLAGCGVDSYALHKGLGRDVTIAIAAVVPKSDREHIVTVSDARLSHGEIIPADDATMKNRKLAEKWGMMFAAEDSSAFIPVFSDAYSSLQRIEEGIIADGDVRDAVQKAYENEFNERFFRQHLSRFGYSDISDFRRNGFGELGKDTYSEYARALASFDLGLELLVYGFAPSGYPRLFEVANPGSVVSHDLRGYATIGSGSLMALAALNRKPLIPDLADTIYRLLDAKFSSETARDVGKKTHVIVMNKQGKHGSLHQADIEKIRLIWQETMKQPNPPTAIDIINNSRAVKATWDGEP
jgi:hypothetical protein